MAESNPTGGDRAVTLLFFCDEQARFLRRTLTACMDGLAADLAEHPCDPAAERWRAERDAFKRLLAGLERGAVVPDPELRQAACAVLAAVDAGNEYQRVVFEHAALKGLAQRLGADDSDATDEREV